MPSRQSTTDPPIVRALPTLYKGYQFRSRLEARWAVFFDEMGLRWDYEVEGYDLGGGLHYLPDFYFPQIGMFGEVKPNDREDRAECAPTAALKAGHFVRGLHRSLILLDGSPRATNYWVLWADELDPVGWDWVDVDFLQTRDRRYHLTEGRLFASTGTPFPLHASAYALGHAEDDPAVLVARTTRFWEAA